LVAIVDVRDAHLGRLSHDQQARGFPLRNPGSAHRGRTRIAAQRCQVRDRERQSGVQSWTMSGPRARRSASAPGAAAISAAAACNQTLPRQRARHAVPTTAPPGVAARTEAAPSVGGRSSHRAPRWGPKSRRPAHTDGYVSASLSDADPQHEAVCAGRASALRGATRPSERRRVRAGRLGTAAPIQVGEEEADHLGCGGRRGAPWPDEHEELAPTASRKSASGPGIVALASCSAIAELENLRDRGV